MATTEAKINFSQIPADRLAEATALLVQFQNLLKPYLVAVSAEERKQMLKMGDKSVNFVEKVADYVETNPEFVPSYMKADIFEGHRRTSEDLTILLRPIEQLLQSLSDTQMIAGSEAYSAALIYYNAVKQAVKNNIPNAETIYEDLSKRFSGQGKKRPSETEK
jgi:hypothetical protein